MGTVVVTSPMVGILVGTIVGDIDTAGLVDGAAVGSAEGSVPVEVIVTFALYAHALLP